MKRMIDILGSLTLLIIFMPIIFVVALIVKVKLGSPVIFKQERPGFNGNPFILYKFRTMVNKVDVNGNLLSDNQRLTPVGLFLRKLSLDEFPQLINVLKGDMSLVGPRPLLMEYLPLYTKEQFKRHYVKPGITGLAQVNGRNAISWEEKFQLDNWYVTNHSLVLDFKILFLTIIKVLKREGIQSDDTQPDFKFSGQKEVAEP